MKKRLRFLFVIFALVLLLPSQFIGQEFCAFAYADVSSADKFVYDNIVSDCFDESSVIVTLTTNATKADKTYTVNDFCKVGCVEVEDLTEYTSSYAKEKTCRISTCQSMLVEIENYKRILKLNLKESGVDSVVQAIKTLKNRNDVFTASPNYTYTANSLPNDEYVNVNQTWGLSGANGIQAESAWGISTGSNAITVGILDSGIQANHPDLVNRISTAGLHRDFTVTPAITVSKNSLIDPYGHGTHVAGIIGAQGNNSIGISGVCWDVSLVSLRVLDENGNGSSESIVQAINFAASQNIPILNFSGGFYGNDDSVKNAANNYAGLLVCAAGNGGYDGIGDDNDITPVHPASYDLPNVISVGSIDRNGSRSDFSNYGKHSVSLFAPGGNILSTYPQYLCTGEIVQTRWGEYYVCECEWTSRYSNGEFEEWAPSGPPHYANGYHFMSGTSMAAPYVTGVAALLLSKNPDMTPEDIKATILGNVDKSDELSTKCVSGGRLNAYNALRNTIHPYVYESIGEGQHRAVCACGNQRVEYHSGLFINTGLFSGHKGTCKICGFYIEELHVWQHVTDTFVCAVCKVKSQRVPVIMSLMSPELIRTLDNANLKNGETVNIGNMVILYDQGQYFLLVEVNDKSDYELKLERLLNSLY